MNRDDLVERVAEALRNNSREEMGEVETPPFSAASVDFREYWLKRARIALAIIEPAVREECARVADDYEPETVVGDGGKLEDESVYSAASAIAAAIRAGAKP